MAIAEAWHVRPTDYLKWTPFERRLTEMYLVAKAIKQNAAMEHREEEDSERAFQSRAQNWASELSRNYQQSQR